MCFSLSLICVSSVCLCIVFGVRLLLCTVLKALVVRERLGAPVWRWRRTPPPPGGGMSQDAHIVQVLPLLLLQCLKLFLKPSVLLLMKGACQGGFACFSHVAIYERFSLCQRARLVEPCRDVSLTCVSIYPKLPKAWFNECA